VPSPPGLNDFSGAPEFSFDAESVRAIERLHLQMNVLILALKCSRNRLARYASGADTQQSQPTAAGRRKQLDGA